MKSIHAGDSVSKTESFVYIDMNANIQLVPILLCISHAAVIDEVSYNMHALSI